MQKIKAVFAGKGFYIALLLCVAAIGVGGYFALFHTPTQNQIEEPIQSVSAPAEVREPTPAPQIPEPIVKTIETAPVVPEKTDESEKVAPVISSPPAVAAPPKLVVNPLEGETVAAFSMTELRYDATMGDWRTHDGIDIQADEGSEVLAAKAGTVRSVYEDAMMGTVVVVDHDNDYQSLYAGLQADPPVVGGDRVTAGQVIGAVGTAAAEADRGPHLHFSVTRSGEPVDPEAFLKR